MAGKDNISPEFNPLRMARSDFKKLNTALRRFIRESLKTLAELLEPFAQPVFAINQPSSLLRSSIFVVGFIAWMGFAYITQLPDMNIQVPPADPGDYAAQMLNIMVYFYRAVIAAAVPFFIPQVFRFVLVIAFASWLAYRVSAIYLADIFELQNVSVASKFIRQAAFYTTNRRKFNRLVIREGSVAQAFRESPIYQIGGPGLVTVNLENIAVFEKVDGEPHIIPPTRRPVPIEGFERLRKIIDLRDQFVENEEVPGRTKDGIPVRAKGVRFSFSVQRDTEISKPLDPLDDYVLPQPLTFTDEAIYNLVYLKPDADFDRIATDDIKSEIRKFIERNTLNQFLADARQEEDQDGGLPSDPTLPLNVGEGAFKARANINRELIHRFKTLAQPTIDLHWVSVGTWLVPPVIPEKHMQAWEQVAQSQLDASPNALTGLYRSSRLKELLRLIQDVPINAFGHVASRQEPPVVIKRELLLAYREKIKNAYDRYREEGKTPPIAMEATLRHLQRL